MSNPNPSSLTFANEAWARILAKLNDQEKQLARLAAVLMS
jgi:hypothetical protein